MNYSLFSISYQNTCIIDWISTIVAIFVLLVSIAALNTWKKEIIAKRKYELTKELYFFIEKFENFYRANIKNNSNIDNPMVNNKFNEFNQKLHEILLEYSYIVNSKYLNLITFFKNLVDENSDDYFQVEIDDDGIQAGSFKWETYCEPDNQKILENKINALKDFCKSVIKEFYLGKDNERLKQRYRTKFYMQIMKEKGRNSRGFKIK